MTLTITPVPTADAGPDGETCAGDDYVFNPGDASATNYSSVNWTSSGGGSFTNGTTLNPTYTPNAADITAGTVVLTLHALGNGSCAEATDPMILTIITVPSGYAGPNDEVICEEDSLHLSSATASDYDSVFWTSTGDGYFSDPKIVNPWYYPGTSDIASGTVSLTITVYHGSCTPFSDEMTFAIRQLPIVDAGSDATICVGDSYTVFDALVSNYSSYIWTRNGTGDLADETTLTPTYTPSDEDVTAGSVTLYLEADGFNPCGTVKDSMEIIIPQELVASIGAPYPFLIDASTEINVCFTGKHYPVQDLGFYLVAPDGFTKIELLESPTGVLPYCNADSIINNFCFSTEESVPFPSCPEDDIPLTGTWASENSWAPLYESNPMEGGWAIEIHDCFSSFDGVLNNVTLNFIGDTPEGPVTVSYDSEDITMPILSPTGAGCRINKYYMPIVTFQTTCFGDCDATAIVSVAGGTQPYTFNWDDPEVVDNDTVDLCAGTFSVIVTDANGCQSFDTVVVTEPNEIVLTMDSTNIACHGLETGMVSVTPTDGIPPYEFLWDTPGSDETATVNNLPAGMYHVTVTDANGCIKDDSVQVWEPDTITVIIAAVDETGCAADDGSITLSPSGGVRPFGYSWSHDGSLNDSIADNLDAGIYYVTITDANGCILDTVDTINNITSLAIDHFDSTSVTCFGYNDGTATVVPSGGETPYLYQWYSDAGFTITILGETDSIIKDMYPDSLYYIEVTDNQTCKVYGNISISEPAILTANIFDSTDVACHGGNTGNATVEGIGGTGIHTYLWQNVSGDTVSEIAVANYLFEGTYYVTVIDEKFCKAYDNVTIEEPEFPLTATFTDTTPAYCGAANGEAIITPTGGTPPYSYYWENELEEPLTTTDSTASGLLAGYYWVTVTDYKYCTYEDSIQIIDTSDLEVIVTIDNHVLCNGDSTGMATATPNGTGPYTYEWSNGETGPIADSLWAGTGTDLFVLVTDILTTCTAKEYFEISEPTAFLVIPTTTDVECNGGENGEAIVSVSGATPIPGLGYTYQWYLDAELNDTIIGETDSILSNLFAGTYYVEIKDDNICSHVEELTVIEPNEITFEYDTTSSNCGQSDGIIEISNINGGTPFTGDVYDVNWVNLDISLDTTTIGTSVGQTHTLEGLPAEIYSITVIDLLNCSTQVTTITIDDITDMEITDFEVSPATCFGDCDGTAKVLFTGGTSPHTFLWSNDDTDTTATGLCGGQNYTVQIIDAIGCEVHGGIDIPQPDELLSNLSIVSPIICYDDSLVTLKVSPTGGTPFSEGQPYDVVWQNASEEIISYDSVVYDLPAGKYFVRITDELSCDVYDSINIIKPEQAISVVIVPTQTECNDSTGTASITDITGGVPYSGDIYLIRWSHPDWTPGDSTGMSIQNLWTDIYYLEVEDSLGCIYYDTVNIEDNSGLNFQFNVSSITCLGRNDGSAEVKNEQGGTEPYTYLWAHDGSTNKKADSLYAQEYKVRVYDAQGCSKLKSITIPEDGALGYNSYMSKIDDKSCPGATEGTGTASIFMGGGYTPYSYQWDDPGSSTETTINNLVADTYTVIVTDNNENTCYYYDTVEILDDPITIDSIIISDVKCYGDSTGSVIAYVTGGNNSSGYTFKWMLGEVDLGVDSDTITDLSKATYKFYVEDAGECVLEENVEVGQPDEYAAIIDITESGCNDSTGVIIIDSYHATPPYYYEWAHAPALTSDTAYNVWVGEFNVIVTDTNNCFLMDTTIKVEDNSDFRLGIGTVTQILCNGDSTGQLIIVPIDGIEPYEYIWSHDAELNLTTASELGPGLYSVTVIDSNTCVRIDTLPELTQPDPFVFDFIEDEPINCPDSCTGSVTVNVEGGTPEYTYKWRKNTVEIPGEVTNQLDSLCNVEYEVQVTDENICSSGYITYTPVAPEDFEVLIDSILFANCNAFDSTGAIYVTITGGTPFMVTPTTYYEYEWSNGEITEDINDIPTGMYIINIKDQRGCIHEDSVLVGANTNILSDAFVYGTSFEKGYVCYGDTIRLTGQYEVDGGLADEIKWEPSIYLNSDTIASPTTISLTNTTGFTFTVYKGNCYNYDSITVVVFPQINAQAMEDDSIFIGDEVELRVIGDTAISAIWIGPNIRIIDDSAKYFASPVVNSPYYLTVTKMFDSDYGPKYCSISDTLLLTVFQDLDPPTAITPNGDGVNDTWIINGVSDYPDVEIQIFNRWGERVFYSKGMYDSPWDGTTTKGKDLPIGTYYFIIDLHDDRGTPPVTGPITIMR